MSKPRFLPALGDPVFQHPLRKGHSALLVGLGELLCPIFMVWLSSRLHGICHCLIRDSHPLSNSSDPSVLLVDHQYTNLTLQSGVCHCSLHVLFHQGRHKTSFFVKKWNFKNGWIHLSKIHHLIAFYKPFTDLSELSLRVLLHVTLDLLLDAGSLLRINW